MSGAREADAKGDLSNGRLAATTVLALLAGVFLSVLVAALPDPWGQPGGLLLQGAAVLGAGMLTAAFVVVFAKRFGRQGKQGFRSHVWLASVGAALVFVHAASGLDRPPAALLALLIFLIALGVWSRMQGARLMAATFGEKPRAFQAPDVDARARLQRIIDAKQALLRDIDDQADEALFSPTPRHWLRAPLAVARYSRLGAEERALTGATATMPRAQALWRLGHRLVAWAFLAGLLGHIAIVMFFARYAADDRAIYWLHFAAWDF